jgi:hypothetical protein
LVFTRPDGRPIRPDWPTHRFTALVAGSGLPPVRLHDLRHGAATIALATHVDLKTVQDMLGHTSYAFTADTIYRAAGAGEESGGVHSRLVLDAVQKVPPPGSGWDWLWPPRDLPPGWLMPGIWLSGAVFYGWGFGRCFWPASSSWIISEMCSARWSGRRLVASIQRR